jgi:hypothetical protein
MPTYLIRPEREVTIALQDVPDATPAAREATSTALHALLRSKGVKTHLVLRNPITWEFWNFGVQLAKDGARNLVVAGALVSIVKAWIAARKGRKVEIHRHNLTIKAPTVKEVRQALEAINDYDRLTLELQTPAATTNKRAASAKKKARRTTGKLRHTSIPKERP